MRLDRIDSYLTEFHASITEVRQDARGLWVALDRSAFYPTAGGQQHDTGTLQVDGHSLSIVDVQVDDGPVWHMLADTDAGGLRSGMPALGRIDWRRRYRHMQRHTGQHILSQALVRIDPDYGTRSVSMRGPECTIDFGGTVDAAALAAVELEANSAARSAHQIMTFEVPDTRLGEYRLRRPSKVTGQVRLVAIGDYDLVACGGTHLRFSAEALPIKIVGLERVKGGLNRLSFIAGEEAHADYSTKHEVTAELSVGLSVPVAGISERVTTLQTDLTEQGRLLAHVRSRQAAALAERLTAEADKGCVSAYLSEDDAPLMDALIDHLQSAVGTVCLLAAAEQDGRTRFAFLAGPGSDVDVRPLLKAALEPLGGRGGGRPDRAQGAATTTEHQAMTALKAATQLLNKTEPREPPQPPNTKHEPD